MSNVMAALPNIGGALCSTLQSLANARKGHGAIRRWPMDGFLFDVN